MCGLLTVFIGGQCPQGVSTETDAIDSFVNGNVPFFGSVHSAARMNAFMLSAITGHGIAAYFQANEVGHHSAAREISSGFRPVAAEIGEPTHDAALHGDGRWADGIGAHVLIECGADEICDDAHWIRRWCDEAM